MHTAKTMTDFSQVIKVLIVSKAAKPQSKAEEQATLFHFIFSRRKQAREEENQSTAARWKTGGKKH